MPGFYVPATALAITDIKSKTESDPPLKDPKEAAPLERFMGRRVSLW